MAVGRTSLEFCWYWYWWPQTASLSPPSFHWSRFAGAAWLSLSPQAGATRRRLQRAVDNLDAYLAATQLGITISSLALGWIGEPALAHLIEPWLSGLLGALATAGSHAFAVAIAFTIITALHIVLGELAPKSLALQRSEGTALRVVRPLGMFLFLLRPGDRRSQRPRQSRAAALWPADRYRRGILALPGRA